MRPKAAPSQKQQTKATEAEPLRDLGIEAERPLDAEDVALSLLEAKVRAEETRADLSPTEPHADLSVRLPRAVILRLSAEAANRNITPSELIKRALMQYLPLQKAGPSR